MKFNSKVYGGYRLRVFPDELDLLRLPSVFLFPISLFAVPYFWDTDINLDLVVEPTKSNKRITHTPWRYKWEICDLDGNVVNNKQGEGEYEFKKLSGLGGKRKKHAIKIGYLKPHRNYNLNITFTDADSHISPPLSMATFTVKDRDEFQMQFFTGLILVIVAIILSRC